MAQDSNDRDNVVDFNHRRKLHRAGAKRGEKNSPNRQPSKIWLAVQLAVFLALVAYLMKSCH